MNEERLKPEDFAVDRVDGKVTNLGFRVAEGKPVNTRHLLLGDEAHVYLGTNSEGSIVSFN